MDFNQLINERRSVRKFAAPASHDDLIAILTKAQRAPSWNNFQPARIYLAEGENDAALRDLLPSFNQNSSKNAALIVTTFVPGQSGFAQGKQVNEGGDLWGAYDLGIHDAYLALAASDLGLDTLIMGIRDADSIRKLLCIPEDEKIMSVIAIGKCAEQPPLRPRKPIDEVVRY